MSQKLKPLRVTELLRKYGLRPKKGLGQNFLIDEAALQKIVLAAAIEPGDTVLEIGPGLGSLTRQLAICAREVIAVELDHKLIPPLKEVIASFDNVTVLQGDILEQDIKTLITTDQYAVVANIPYYITSAVIRHLLEAPVKPTGMVLTIQKEVAMRICATPPNMNLLALSVQVYGSPKISAKIPAGAFYPAPNVDSAVIHIDLFDKPTIPPPYTEIFFKLAKAGFSQKRKNLRNSLSGGLGRPKNQIVDLLATANIDPTRRAETLNLEEWEQLARQFANLE